ncbi:hypothetical protein BC940DRAFT_43105 [Gongronella butleri]|nr:hypothetical protein BC940DRAFT_43105 [Gongronella butleri]
MPRLIATFHLFLFPLFFHPSPSFVARRPPPLLDGFVCLLPCRQHTLSIPLFVYLLLFFFFFLVLLSRPFFSSFHVLHYMKFFPPWFPGLRRRRRQQNSQQQPSSTQQQHQFHDWRHLSPDQPPIPNLMVASAPATTPSSSSFAPAMPFSFLPTVSTTSTNANATPSTPSSNAKRNDTSSTRSPLFSLPNRWTKQAPSTNQVKKKKKLSAPPETQSISRCSGHCLLFSLCSLFPPLPWPFFFLFHYEMASALALSPPPFLSFSFSPRRALFSLFF